MDGSDVESQVRAICTALPEVTERLSHATPCFFVRKQFLTLWPEGHHDHHFPHLWCAAPSGAQEALVATSAERYFRPPYVGSRGWIGFRLDGPVDVGELRLLCEEAYRCVAPKTLLAVLDARTEPLPHEAANSPVRIAPGVDGRRQHGSSIGVPPPIRCTSDESGGPEPGGRADVSFGFVDHRVSWPRTGWPT